MDAPHATTKQVHQECKQPLQGNIYPNYNLWIHPSEIGIHPFKWHEYSFLPFSLTFDINSKEHEKLSQK